MRELTATEFHRTLEVIRREELGQRVEHLYYAQFASLLACVPSLVWGKEPPKEFLKIDTWMFDLTSTPEQLEERAKELQAKREQEAAEHSVSVWEGIAAAMRKGPDLPPDPYAEFAIGPSQPASFGPSQSDPSGPKEARQTRSNASSGGRRRPRIAVRGVEQG